MLHCIGTLATILIKITTGSEEHSSEEVGIVSLRLWSTATTQRKNEIAEQNEADYGATVVAREINFIVVLQSCELKCN